MRKQVFLLCFLFAVVHAGAMVRIPSILASGMVLQQNSIVSIWGWASVGETVTISASWLEEAPHVVAGPDGKWKIKIPTGAAGGPHLITITGGNTIHLNDILFGEVWVCSGQSNMEFTINNLGGWKQYKVEKKDIERNDYSPIRLCQIARTASPFPADSCKATWSRADDHTVAEFSATAFFFARTLYNWLHVPIGLISSNWGGTPAEAWTDESFLKADTALGYFLEAPNGHYSDAGKPSWLFNAMIHPLLNYQIKGVIWYQGETNIHDADLYRKLFSTMIESWRSAWGIGKFPFYYVQIAPFDYGDSFHSAAWLREAQLQCLSVENTGMVVTLDIGNVRDIHPKNKPEVGMRLALWALAKTYGKQVQYSGPVFKGLKKEGSALRIFFDYSEDGLMQKGDILYGFSIAGADEKFRKAKARIDGSSVFVECDSVKDPENVRYAFSDTASSCLFNRAGLPCSSFRSDHKSLLVREVKISILQDSITGLVKVSLGCKDYSCRIHYTLDGTEPCPGSPEYGKPFSLSHSAVIRARAYKQNTASALISQSCFELHLGFGKRITVKTPCSPNYTAGVNPLLDGIHGSNDFRDGHWQGYQGADFNGTVDLGQPTAVHRINVSFLQNTGSWIFLPENVKISISEDGEDYHCVADIDNAGGNPGREIRIQNYSWESAPEKQLPVIRYIRIVAKNIGVCPKWHPGKGGKAWLFTDEISITSVAQPRVKIEHTDNPEQIFRKAAFVTPAPRQLAWQQMEFIGFIHFGLNTFYDREWGEGNYNPERFNPVKLDARQWVRTLRDAGMKMVILTAKHHDGFCLWPTKLSAHNISASRWKDGKGDLIREVSDACKEYGMKFGFYLSPWDRHEPSYGDSLKYNSFFCNQLKELLSNYGTISEVWLDGACGEGASGRRQVYDWSSYFQIIRNLQPGAVIAIMGPDTRWVGNESGYGRETEWSVLPGMKYPHDLMEEDLGSREKIKGADELVWYPAETDVSIRPGWFYHTKDDSLVKSPEKLVDIYFNSVGRNSVLLLNVPPDSTGLVSAIDAGNLLRMRKMLDGIFRDDLLKDASCQTADKIFEYTMKQPQHFNVAMIREDISVGQRIEKFHLDAWDGKKWITFGEGTTVGYKRLLRFTGVTASRVRLVVEQSRGIPVVAGFGLFQSPETDSL